VPTFSVVICTYNRAAVLPRAIDAVLAQTFGDFELVVVDDGSTDATADVVASVPDPRVRYVHQANTGLGGARNVGVDNSSGDYVVFLDDDDVALPGWLQSLHARLVGEDCAVVCCGEVVIDDSDRALRTNLPGPLGPVFADCSGLFVAGTFAVRRDAYDAVGGFVVGLEDLQQTEFALRLSHLCRSRGWGVCIVTEPLLQRHVHAPGGKRFTAENLVKGTEYVLAHHRDKLARSPWILAQYCAIAGVAAARSGDYRAARRFFREATRARPRAWKHRMRLALSFVPPVADVVWKARAYRSSSSRGA
jgi:glycosyltransferase involved in cell wall biosynthesis